MLRPYFPPLLPLDRSGQGAEWSRRESPWEAPLSDARSKPRLVSSRGGSDGLAAPTATARPAQTARTRISSRSPRFSHRHTFRAAVNFLGTRCPRPSVTFFSIVREVPIYPKQPRQPQAGRGQDHHELPNPLVQGSEPVWPTDSDGIEMHQANQVQQEQCGRAHQDAHDFLGYGRPVLEEPGRE